MNTKIIAATLTIIIICTSAIGYIAYQQHLAQQNGSPVELRVFVATSLANVVTNISQTFNAENNCNIILNSAGSNTLYQQIIAGSPCDVYMAADFKWANQLNTSRLLLNGNYVNFTSNTLQVIMPKNNPQNITSLLDLVKPGVKIVVADPSVPVGSYTNTTLTKIDAAWGNYSSPRYLGEQWRNYRANFLANVVSYETSVESIVGKVSLGLGTADAGVAFASDAAYSSLTGTQLKHITIPSDVNTQGVYAIAVAKSTTQPELAQRFMDYWSSTQGQRLLQEFGFGT